MEIEIIKKYVVKGVEFDTMKEASAYADRMELISFIEEKGTEYFYKDGGLVDATMDGIFELLDSLNLKIVNKEN